MTATVTVTLTALHLCFVVLFCPFFTVGFSFFHACCYVIRSDISKILLLGHLLHFFKLTQILSIEIFSVHVNIIFKNFPMYTITTTFMATHHHYLWWRWWSDTLWVTVIRLWPHSFLSCYFQTVVLDYSRYSDH